MCTLYRNESTGTHYRRRKQSLGSAMYQLWRRHRLCHRQKSSAPSIPA